MKKLSLELDRLNEQGLSLPPIKLSHNGTAPYKKVGDLVFVSGIGPLGDDGKLAYTGRVGAEYTVEEGYKAARLAGLNVLQCVKDASGGLENVDFVLKSVVCVSAPQGFGDIYKVADGFSDALTEALGSRGLHARNAVGASTLNGNAPVICDAIVKLRNI